MLLANGRSDGSQTKFLQIRTDVRARSGGIMPVPVCVDQLFATTQSLKGSVIPVQLLRSLGGDF